MSRFDLTERAHTESLMAEGRRRFRGAVIIKHSDRFTGHIPDVQWLMLDRSCWTEIKHLGKKTDTLKKKVEMAQLVFGQELSRTCGGRAFVTVYDDVRKRTEIWRPMAMAHALWPKVTGGGAAPLNGGHGLSLEEIRLAQFDLFRLLVDKGMLWTEGVSHDLTLRVIENAVRGRND